MTGINFKALREGAKLPTYGTEQAAGADIYACTVEPMTLRPGERMIVNTGWAVELPKNCEMQIRPRSGLAIKQGITVLNAPGTIDADYRGEVGVMLINLGEQDFDITHGDRIAQAVIAYAPQQEFVWADVISNTDRDEGGYGSTGVSE
jgi:dUTP pyrophosphatase